MLEIKEKFKNPLKKSSFDDHLSWTLLRKKISELDRSVETSHSEMQKKKKEKHIQELWDSLEKCSTHGKQGE